MSTTYEFVLVEREGAIATVTVNRPDKRNALNAKVISELTHAIHHFRFAKGEEAVRGVILTGSGDKAFVAGADIAAMSTMSPPEAYAFAEAGHRLGYQIEMSPFPVIAAVNGFALGGGCELMLACDLAYASENAQFGQPEVNLGVIPGFGGTQRLSRRVGTMKARELVYTGDIINAAEAYRAGLVNAVVPLAELLPKAREVANKIASKGPLAIAQAKRVIHKGQDLELTAAHELEAQAFGVLFGSADQKEGMAAFLEKRKAEFKGLLVNMCELLGMECNVPTDIVFSFSGLALRGGLKGPHADGWGLALYEGRVARLFLEPSAAAHSPLATYIRKNPIKTLLAIAHVRKRTRGRVSLANTHPFVRELWGRQFVFAHNGTVKNVRRFPLGRFLPLGDTDSEYAFCVLMEELSKTFSVYPRRTRELWEAIAAISGRIGCKGTFNFLLGDGVHLYARCATKLCYLVRKAPFKRATLADDDVTVDFAEVTTPNDRVAVIATAPLTRDETWTIGIPGEMWVFRGGTLRATLASGVAATAPTARSRRLPLEIKR